VSGDRKPIEVWAAVKGDQILWFIIARTREGCWLNLERELHFGRKNWWTQGSQDTSNQRDRARRRGFDVVKATLTPGWEDE
jgi:hypothetical protein